MKKVISSFVNFLDLHLFYVVFGLGVLSTLPYVKFLKFLEIDNTPGLIYRAIIFGFSLLLSLLCFKKQISKVLLIFLGIYTVSSIISLVFSPIVNHINVPIITRLTGVAVIFGNILSVFIAFFLLYNKTIELQKFRILVITSAIIGLILCLYTYVFEFEDIKNTFIKDYGWNYDVTSIFSSKNNYGYCLFAISTSIVLYALISHRYWLYSLPIFFLLNTIIARSKTAILCISIVLLGVLIYYILKTWDKHKKTWLISLSIILLTILIFTILTCLKIGPFAILNKFISEVIVGDGIVVVKDRIYKAGFILNSINGPFNYIFGCGERITNYIIAPAKISGDEIYISVFATGGIIKLLLYVCLIAYIFRKYINNNLSKPIKMIQCVVLSSYLVAGLFESDSLIGINTGLLITSIIYSSNALLNNAENNINLLHQTV